jgi:hypothetical protein
MMILDGNPLLDIFSWAVSFPLILLTLSFTEQKFVFFFFSFYLNNVQLTNFFHEMCLCVLYIYIKSLLYPRSSRFSPVLSSRGFAFWIRTMVHFGLIFVKGMRCVCLCVFVCVCPVVSAPFVEKTLFFLLHCFCAFVKNGLTVFP